MAIYFDHGDWKTGWLYNMSGSVWFLSIVRERYDAIHGPRLLGAI